MCINKFFSNEQDKKRFTFQSCTNLYLLDFCQKTVQNKFVVVCTMKTKQGGANVPLINNSIFALAGSGNVLPAVITGILVLFVTAPLTWFIAIENRKRNYELGF